MTTAVNGEAVASGAITDPAPFDVWDDGTLSDLVATLTSPRPYAQYEAIEVWIKHSWMKAGIENLDAAGRVRFARFFQQIGFVPKYKSYGVKYATPFGYSLFDLEDAGGFS